MNWLRWAAPFSLLLSAGIACQTGPVQSPSDPAGPVQSPSDPECPKTEPAPGATCSGAIQCSYGTERCCGQTHASQRCTCFDGRFSCYSTEACFAPICDGDGDGGVRSDGDGGVRSDGDGGVRSDGDGGVRSDGDGGVRSDGGGDTISCTEVTKSFAPNLSPPAAPPYGGTIFIDPDIITPADPTALVAIVAKGTETRQMYDRRTDAFGTYTAHLFDARFGATKHIEVQVNSEFSLADATTHATNYARAIGRLPSFLLRDVDTVWIHAGRYPFGGGNRNLLIHTLQGDDYLRDGILEETLVHEATHTSVDADHATNAAWLEAQTQDKGAISTYARDNPTREDLAETLLLYLAERFRADRIAATVASDIRRAIPNRLIYLRCQKWNMDIER